MRLLRFIITAAVLALAATGAEAGTDQTQTVAEAATTVERLSQESAYVNNIQPKIRRARAVLIVPHLVKGGFIVGASYGNGVLLTRREDGSFSYPAFYRLAAGSLGLQIGIEDSEVVFVIMTEKGLRSVMKDNFKFGADIGVAVATIGAGVEAATTGNLGADIYAFSRNYGLFGGGALEGSAINPRHNWNAYYYGGTPLPDEIVNDSAYANPQADALRDILARQ